MNLFRSEESVRQWSDFDPETANQIKPVADWAQFFMNARLTKSRLAPDFVEKSEEYVNEAFAAIGALLS